MGKLSKYSGSYAKTCAMKGKLLNSYDYEQLLNCVSLFEIVSYLKKTDAYGELFSDTSDDKTDRIMFEKILSHGIDNDLVKLRHFMSSDGKKLMTLLVMKKEIEVLKQIVRCVEGDAEYKPDALGDGYLYSNFSVDVQKLSSSENIFEFIENLNGSRYYEPLVRFVENPEHLTLFKIEMILDCFYYKYAKNYAQKSLKGKDRELMLSVIGSEADCLNIMWIIRGKFTFYLPKEIIYSFLLPINYRFNKNTVISMVEAESEDELYDLISDTVYGKFFEKRGALPELNLEKGIFSRDLKIAKLNPFSVFGVLEYCNEKETEIKNIMKIAEAVQYGADKSEIRDYLVLKGGIQWQ